MDKFRVGQRVRIVKSNMRPEFKGVICTVISPREKSQDPITQEISLTYTLDLPNEFLNGKKYSLGAPEDALEPVYDGDEKSSWSECAWNPNKVKA